MSNPSHHRAPSTHFKSAAWRPGGGDEWRWHSCHLAGIHSRRRDAERQRRRDPEPQVPTSLADKSNLSPWPLTSGGCHGAFQSKRRWSMLGLLPAGWTWIRAAVRIIKTPAPLPRLLAHTQIHIRPLHALLNSLLEAGAHVLLSLPALFLFSRLNTSQKVKLITTQSSPLMCTEEKSVIVYIRTKWKVPCTVFVFRFYVASLKCRAMVQLSHIYSVLLCLSTSINCFVYEWAFLN